MIKEEFVNELRGGGQDTSASKERLWNVSQEERKIYMLALAHTHTEYLAEAILLKA